MDQKLDLKTYPREEIAELLKVNIKDIKHLKRNIITKLDKCCYSYIYLTKKIIITKLPTTPKEKMKEFLFNQLDLDIDIYEFSAFLCILAEEPAMPWGKKKK